MSQTTTTKAKGFKSENGLDYVVAIPEGANAIRWYRALRQADQFIVRKEVFDDMLQHQKLKFDKDIDVPAQLVAPVQQPEEAVVIEEKEESTSQ